MRAVRLGGHWIAVVHDSGVVDLLYQSEVIDRRGWSVKVDQLHPSQVASLEARNEDVLVRTFRLTPTGSLEMDSHAVSPNGIPQHPFEQIPSLHKSASTLLPALLKNPREE